MKIKIGLKQLDAPDFEIVYEFFSRPSPKAGRELQTELDRRIMN